MERFTKNRPNLQMLLIFVAVGLIACGGGGGGGGGGVNTTLAGPPTIVSSTPADGATGVSVTTSQIQITFSESIDDSFQDAMIVGSFDIESFEGFALGYNLMRYIRYDDNSRTLTIDMQGFRDLELAEELQAGFFGRYMEWDAQYRIVLSGIRDVGGEEVIALHHRCIQPLRDA